MTKLPSVSGREAMKAFEKVGYVFSHATGSHHVYKKSDKVFHLSIPNHPELRKGTLRSLIRAADITVDQFIGLL